VKQQRKHTIPKGAIQVLTEKITIPEGEIQVSKTEKEISGPAERLKKLLLVLQ